MSRFLDPIIAINARFKELVEDVLAIPVQYGNAPEIDKPTPELNASWVRLSVRPGQSALAAFGGKELRHRTPGIAFAQVFVAAESGEAPALTIADAIDNAFRLAAIPAHCMTFQTPSVTVVGVTGSWYQINVEIPFIYDTFNERISP